MTEREPGADPSAGLGNRGAMEYDEEVRLFYFVAGVVCGSLLGASVALVPDSGRKTRRRIQRAAGDLREMAVDRWDEIADEVIGKVEEVLRTMRSKLF